VDWVFGFAGICFAASAVSALFLVEPPDDYRPPSEGWKQKLSDSFSAIRENRNFARLCLAAALSGSSIVLFPHYQAMGLGAQEDRDYRVLVLWVVMQNLGTGAFSVLVGPIADWRGNRIVVRLSLLLIVLLPVAALVLARLGEFGHAAFFLVFVFLGLTPVTLRLLNNYTLEICPPKDHPRYLSTLNLCQVFPALLAPGVGAAIDLTSMEAVFLSVAAINAAGWLLTWKLDEPRHRLTGEMRVE
jgi:MFS family permease